MNKESIDGLCKKVKVASRKLALVGAKEKAMALTGMARGLIACMAHILSENRKDVEDSIKNNLSSVMIERLTLSESKIRGMARSLIEIAGFKDPVGKILETTKRPNGLFIKKVTVPIGVILIIYESRPNVTGDCAGLCIKSSNAVILRGGKEALRSNIAIFNILRKEIIKAGLPADSIALITETDRGIVDRLLTKSGLIDLVMPRGGESLISEVTKKSRIPVIKHYKGVCHTFVDASADLKMAEEICFNAKVERPGVCNAMETMLVHRKIADKFLPVMIKRFKNAGVQMRGCSKTRAIDPSVKKATELDWYTEYLDLKLSVRIVSDVDEAIAHIMKYGTFHSDAIVTKNSAAAEKFLNEVDSACVYVNASTRFTDGVEFGKGAEIGISTDKIHARGPMGPDELVSYKYVVYGSGQVRK
jgi:glutamate-5-semialdehyde dehydrogenase